MLSRLITSALALLLLIGPGRAGAELSDIARKIEEVASSNVSLRFAERYEDCEKAFRLRAERTAFQENRGKFQAQAKLFGERAAGLRVAAGLPPRPSEFSNLSAPIDWDKTRAGQERELRFNPPETLARECERQLPNEQEAFKNALAHEIDQMSIWNKPRAK